MNTTTHIGLMPLTTTNYGQLYSRRPIYIEEPTNIKPYPGIKWLYNINHDPRQPFEFSKDMVWYREQLLKIPLSILRPTNVLAIENEADHDLTKNIDDYLNQLKTAVETLPEYRITNSGFTLPLYYWYYQKSKEAGLLDSDFLDNCVPLSAQVPLLRGLLDERIRDVQTELDVLKSLPIAFWNIHFYLTQAGQVAPMVRMIEYVKEYVGKPAISNECGIYAEGLLPDVISIAKETGMRFCILYSGGELCLPISKDEFQQAIK